MEDKQVSAKVGHVLPEPRSEDVPKGGESPSAQMNLAALPLCLSGGKVSTVVPPRSRRYARVAVTVAIAKSLLIYFFPLPVASGILQARGEAKILLAAD